MSSVSINESAVRDEAVRIFRQRQEQERRAALERQRATERSLAEQAARERELRLQREAEEIEARRRAEAAIIAAQARAEKEAHDAAVAAYLAELEGRSPQEKLMAELESLRDQLSDRVAALDSNYTSLHRDYTTYKSTSPWASGLDEIKGMIRALDTKFTKEIGDLRSQSQPQRAGKQITFWASAADTIAVGGALPAGQNRQFTVRYRFQSPTGFSADQSIRTTENACVNINVPQGNYCMLLGANWEGGPLHTPIYDSTTVVRKFFDC